MTAPASPWIFREEALASYRAGWVPVADTGIGRAPRWPMLAIAGLLALALVLATTVHIPAFAQGMAVAGGDESIRAVFPGVPEPAVRPAQRATLMVAGQTVVAEVVSTEEVPDRARADSLGVPASITPPVTVASLRAEEGITVAGWSGELTVRTSNSTLLRTLLAQEW